MITRLIEKISTEYTVPINYTEEFANIAARWMVNISPGTTPVDFKFTSMQLYDALTTYERNEVAPMIGYFKIITAGMGISISQTDNLPDVINSALLSSNSTVASAAQLLLTKWNKLIQRFPALTIDGDLPTLSTVERYLAQITKMKEAFMLSYSPVREIGALALTTGEIPKGMLDYIFSIQNYTSGILVEGVASYAKDAAGNAAITTEGLYGNQKGDVMFFYVNPNPSEDYLVLDFDIAPLNFDPVGAIIRCYIQYKEEDDWRYFSGATTATQTIVFASVDEIRENVTWVLKSDTGEELELDTALEFQGVREYIEIPLLGYPNWGLYLRTSSTAIDDIGVFMSGLEVYNTGSLPSMFTDSDGNILSSTTQLLNAIGITSYITADMIDKSSELEGLYQLVIAYERATGTSNTGIVPALINKYNTESTPSDTFNSIYFVDETIFSLGWWLAPTVDLSNSTKRILYTLWYGLILDTVEYMSADTKFLKNMAKNNLGTYAL
jgi:hypothetical protein